MNQTRLESLLESSMNIAIGFFISLVVWIYVVVPIWDIPVTPVQNVAVTMVFTVSSLARAYVLRRFFNAGLHKACRNLARRFTNV